MRRYYERFNPEEIRHENCSIQDQIGEECTVYADCQKRRPDITKISEYNESVNKRQKDEAQKHSLLVQRILKEQSSNEGISEAIEKFLKDKVGATLGLKNLGQIIEQVKQKNLVYVLLLQQTTLDDLGIEIPKPVKKEEEQKADEEVKSQRDSVKDDGSHKDEEDNDSMKTDENIDKAQPEEAKADEKPEEEKKVEEETQEQKLNKLLGEVIELAQNHHEEGKSICDAEGEYNRQYFHKTPQFRLLMQLDQVIGIAEKDSLINSLLSESLNPANLKFLFELITQAQPLV